MNVQLFAKACFVLSASLMLAFTSNAAELPVPAGKPVLVISGKISVTNAQGTAVFDRDMLEALGSATIRTNTPWYDGTSEFTGVPLHVLMEAVGAEGRTVTAVALNDYMTTIPIEDFATFKPLLALKRNGDYMAVREKGPLFIIYPFDSDQALQTQTYYGRSAWQVARLIVE